MSNKHINYMQPIIENNKLKIAEICKDLNIKTLHVFGSATTNRFNKDSDIDFLLSFPENISIEQYTDNYFELHYKLRELLNREIDITTERSLSNPYFIESVNETKQLLYEAWNIEILIWYSNFYKLN